MILAIGIALIVGMIIGRFFKDDETCPRRVLGYDCRLDCDHSKSLLYTNMAAMAKNAEEAEANKDRNLWRGDSDAEN